MSFSVPELEKNFWHPFLCEESHIAHRKFQVRTRSLVINIDQKGRNRTDSKKWLGAVVIACASSICFFPGTKLRINMQKKEYSSLWERRRHGRGFCVAAIAFGHKYPGGSPSAPTRPGPWAPLRCPELLSTECGTVGSAAATWEPGCMAGGRHPQPPSATVLRGCTDTEGGQGHGRQAEQFPAVVG